MVNKYEESRDFWDKFGVDPPVSYYGSDLSVFRIHPGYVQQTCNVYDNTRRPWYVAGSSGPKVSQYRMVFANP